MGIFKKGKDEIDLDMTASEDRFKDSTPSESAFSQQPQPAASVSKPAAPPQNYGIEDAIELMRKLPNVNSDITITVVKKTLESANIQVSQIISDAERKENQIETRTSQLSQEINELEERIARLNSEITELTADLKETSKVKTLLIGAAEQEPKPSKAKAEPVKAASEPPAQAKPASTQSNEQLPLSEESRRA